MTNEKIVKRYLPYDEDENIILNRQISAEQSDNMFIPTPYDSIKEAITQKKFIEMGRGIENIN